MYGELFAKKYIASKISSILAYLFIGILFVDGILFSVSILFSNATMPGQMQFTDIFGASSFAKILVNLITADLEIL
jgi:hypothetical protein